MDVDVESVEVDGCDVAAALRDRLCSEYAVERDLATTIASEVGPLSSQSPSAFTADELLVHGLLRSRLLRDARVASLLALALLRAPRQQGAALMQLCSMALVEPMMDPFVKPETEGERGEYVNLHEREFTTNLLLTKTFHRREDDATVSRSAPHTPLGACELSRRALLAVISSSQASNAQRLLAQRFISESLLAMYPLPLEVAHIPEWAVGDRPRWLLDLLRALCARVDERGVLQFNLLHLSDECVHMLLRLIWAQMHANVGVAGSDGCSALADGILHIAEVTGVVRCARQSLLRLLACDGAERGGGSKRSTRDRIDLFQSLYLTVRTWKAHSQSEAAAQASEEQRALHLCIRRVTMRHVERLPSDVIADLLGNDAK